MKKLFIMLFIIVSLFIVGCKKEESETGDINYKKNVGVLTNEINYETDSYNIYIQTDYQGMPYNDSIFSYMINDDNGMFIVEYKDLLKKDNMDGFNTYFINDKEYLYELNNDVMDIYYNLDNDNYLYISIQNLNDDFNEDNILFLFNQLSFEITIK